MNKKAKFKVGDTVEILETNCYQAEQYKIGMIGTITEITAHDCRVDINGLEHKRNWFPFSDIKLIDIKELEK